MSVFDAHGIAETVEEKVPPPTGGSVFEEYGIPEKPTLWTKAKGFMSGLLPKEHLSGKVSRVVDGDTIIMDNGERVRLIGVDTPETKHPKKPVEQGGEIAYKYTKALAEGKKVRLEFDREKRDKYGRLLAYAYLPDGTLLNKKIVEDAFGYSYQKYPFEKSEEFETARQERVKLGPGHETPNIGALEVLPERPETERAVETGRTIGPPVISRPAPAAQPPTVSPAGQPGAEMGPLGRALNLMGPMPEMPEIPSSEPIRQIEEPAITMAPGKKEILTAPTEKPGLMERAIPEFMQKPKELSAKDKAKATNILALSEATGIAPNEIEKSYDAITSQLGIRGTPTTKELMDHLMRFAIGGGLGLQPVRTALGLLTYMGAKEAESVTVQAAKGERPKVLAGREAKEFLPPLREPFESGIEALEFFLPAGFAGKVTKPFGDWFTGLTAKEKGLVRLSVDDLVKRGYKEAELARMSTGYWKEALSRRMKGETPPEPPKAEAPPKKAPEAKPEPKVEAKVTTEVPKAEVKPEPAKPIKEQALRPAIIHEDELIEGEVGWTHPDILEANEIKPETPHERGFVTPEGEFLDRVKAKEWVKENQPEVAKELQKLTGTGEELYSEHYREAAGIEPPKEVPSAALEGKKPEGVEREYPGVDTRGLPERPRSGGGDRKEAAEKVPEEEKGVVPKDTKVTHPTGEPMVMYHASDKPVEFKETGKEIKFYSRPLTEEFGPHVVKAYLDIKNPAPSFDEWRTHPEKYDGLFYPAEDYQGKPGYLAAVKSPKQIIPVEEAPEIPMERPGKVEAPPVEPSEVPPEAQVEKPKEDPRQAAIGAISGYKVEQAERAGLKFVWGGSPDDALGPLTGSHVDRLKERGIGVEKVAPVAETPKEEKPAFKMGDQVQWRTKQGWLRTGVIDAPIDPTENQARVKRDRDTGKEFVLLKDLERVEVPEEKPDLTVTGQSKPSPDRPGVQYVVHKAKVTEFDDRPFRVIMTRPGEGVWGGFLSVDGKGYTAEEAYQNALINYDEKSKKPLTKAAEKPTPAKIPEAQIADRVADVLKTTKGVISPQDLFKWADEAYGGTQAEGKYTPKDAYDALELGVNKRISESSVTDPTVDAKFAKGQVTALKVMTDKLPTQTKRTEEQGQFQQFSTPPALAYTANWVANINKEDVYLEPSAGIGGLAVFGKNAGAKEVIVNELSPRRAEILKELGFDRVFQENAEQLNNILPKDVQPSVIVMNPPFSQTAGRMGDLKQTFTGANHVEQALKRLLDNGRLVAILGRGMAFDRPAFTPWWNKIKADYTVKANIGVSGEEYRKYGTSFDNQLIVIDKTGPTTKTPLSGQVEKVEDLIDLLKGVRDERPEITTRAVVAEQKPAEPPVKAGAPEVGGESRPVLPVQPAVGEPRPGERTVQAERPIPRGKRPADVEVGPGERGEVAGAERPGRADRPPVEAGEPKPGEPSVSDIERTGAQVEPSLGVSVPLESIEVEKKVSEKAKEEFSDSIYESYRPQKALVPGSKTHPGKLVESAAMSVVEPPDPTYKPNLPKDIISMGRLSGAQLESVIYAGQAHSEMLPGTQKLDDKDVPYRRGYFIGDGTGVGKGREISGILLDNWRQGRKKAVWISQNSPLINDAKRDVKGIGWNSELIFDFGKNKIGTPVKTKDGIAFIGYDLLKSKKTQPTILPGEKKEIIASRLNQLIDWFGKDYDGVIVFDESHNLGNAVAVRGKMGMTKPAEKALAGVELQHRLPNARVLYVSATGATEVMNLSYADRLGLWGEGTPFANKHDFISNISSGGVAAMEMVARDMKAMGNYLSRSLSYDDVKYDPLEHQLSPEQTQIYNDLAKGWQVCLQNINEALKVTSPTSASGRPLINGRAKAAAMSAFWGSHQRFFNQIITSMQTPSVITSIEKDIQAGHAAVVQLVNTNEAAQERAIARLEEDQELEDLDMTPREQLMDLIKNSFPVQQYESYVDDSGNVRTRPVFDSQGRPVENADAVAMREALLDNLGAIKVPEGPMEMLLNHFGVEKVAEVTGRQRRVVNIRDEKGERKIIEKRSQAKAMVDADAFAHDKKKILIFSYAGGTGRSYHADLGIKNQRLRRHYLLQAGWRADRAIQGFGRTHRSSQKQAPEYVLVTTDLKGQKRFISSIARRLDQLGALTRGQRETGGGGFFNARDNLESVYAQRALDNLIEDLYRQRVPEMAIQDFEEQTGIRVTDEHGGLVMDRMPPVTQFLNRILSMTIDMQNKFFDLFSERMDRHIQMAIEDGTLDAGMETLRAKKVEKLNEQVVYTDKSGAETKYVEFDVTNDAPLLKFNEAGQYAKEGFVQNIKSGRTWAVSPVRTRTNRYGEIESVHGLTGVERSRHNVLKEDIDDPEKYKKLSKEESKVLWDKEYSEHPKEMKHREHMISGTLLPIWDRLVGHPRIMRVQTEEGERFIGRIINPGDVARTLNNLGASQSAVKMTGKQAKDSVIKQNYSIDLANDWKIVRRKVSGEDRIEITGVPYNFVEQLKGYGAFTERINYETRVFVPTTEKGNEVLEKVLKDHPIVAATPPVTSKLGGILGSEAGFIDLRLLTPGLEAVTDIAKGAASLALPTTKSPEHLRAAELLGSKLGGMHRDAEGAAKMLEKDSDAFVKMGVHNPDIPLAQNEGIHFMSDMSQGRPMVPEMERIARKVKNIFDDRLIKLEEAGAALETVRENYFPGMWTLESRKAFNQAVDEAIQQQIGTRPAIWGVATGPQNIPIPLDQWTPQEKGWVKKRADEIIKGEKLSDKSGLSFLTKRPFKGKESFRKQKVFDDIMTGVEFGLRPISPNPIDLVKLKLAEMDRSIMANRALREWEGKGDVINVNNSGRPLKKALQVGFDPTEWAKIDDKYGTIWHRDPDTHMLEKIGNRVAKAPVAEILNNYLSSSLYNSPYFGTAFKAYMGVANALNQSQLGMGSAFHAGFTSIDVQISQNANVIRDLYGVLRGNRTFGQLAETVKKVPTAMVRTSMEGAKVLREWRTPTLDVSADMDLRQLSQTPEVKVAIIAKAAEVAGAGFKLEQGLKTEWTDKMVQEWYGGEKVKAGLRTPVATVELLAKPIMEWLVPRQKAGVFGEFAWRTIEQNPGKTLNELRPQLRKDWNSVDARLGQVRYDRLFIVNWAKNVIQGLIRAPGWTGGTIAEVAGGVKDLGKFFFDWARTGKAPQEFPNRAAYDIALLATVCGLNGLLTYAFTGESPEGMDWWAFRTGGYDEEGRPERFVLPSYNKDLFAYYMDLGHTVLAKTHPLLGIIAGIYQNRDYYNVKIRQEDDPWIKQWLVDVPVYAAKQFVPFWIRGASKEAQRGGGLLETLKEEPQKLIAPEFGIMPATKAYTMTQFERYAQRKKEEHGRYARTRTSEEWARTQKMREFERAIRAREPGAKQELELAARAGEVTKQEARRIEEGAKEDFITKTAKGMEVDDIARGIEFMTDEEWAIVKPIFDKKIQRSHVSREKKQEYKELVAGR
jgi:endonuclease YncB( thermonuclease family)